MKFIGSLIFWIVFVIVCIPILFFAPILVVLFLVFCIGWAVFALFINKTSK